MIVSDKNGGVDRDDEFTSFSLQPLAECAKSPTENRADEEGIDYQDSLKLLVNGEVAKQDSHDIVDEAVDKHAKRHYEKYVAG